MPVSLPGSYKLVKNLTFTGSSGACLMITASGVTLDLAGFTISGRTNVPPSIESTAILGSGDLRGIAVQNGSVSGFQIGVNLGSATGSLVEKLRVFDITPILPGATGIIASGIVRSNAVFGPLTTFPVATGISAMAARRGSERKHKIGMLFTGFISDAKMDREIGWQYGRPVAPAQP
jgi:hypothetical protein